MISASWLCPNCTKSEKASYERFVEDLASLPLLWQEWSFSSLLWELTECPVCGGSFPPLLDGQYKSLPNAPMILEHFSSRFSQRNREGVKYTSLKDSFGRGLRTEVLWDASVWVAVVVASGILGNVTYDVIKNTVLSVNRRVRERRQTIRQSPSGGIDKREAMPVTLREAQARIAEARKAALAVYGDLQKAASVLENEPELSFLCSQLDGVFRKQVGPWESLSDSDLASLVRELFERAQSELEGVRRIPA